MKLSKKTKYKRKIKRLKSELKFSDHLYFESRAQFFMVHRGLERIEDYCIDKIGDKYILDIINEVICIPSRKIKEAE